jgi:quercetin dioxygenase-like cupin family protein
MGTTDDHSHPGRAVQQAPGLWRTDLQRQDLSVPGREMVQSRVDIGLEAPLVKHTHPGEEIIYVLRGRWSIRSRASRRRRTAPVRP